MGTQRTLRLTRLATTYVTASDTVRLKEFAEVKTNFPDADFWLIRKNTEDKVGKQTNDYNPEHVGVKILYPLLFDKKFVQYKLEYLWMSGYWKSRSKGSLRLQNITVSDVQNMVVFP